jgi:type II secretory pathway component PulC
VPLQEQHSVKSFLLNNTNSLNLILSIILISITVSFIAYIIFQNKLKIKNTNIMNNNNERQATEELL